MVLFERSMLSQMLVWFQRIGAVLAENDLGGSYPEDLMNLMRQAVGIIDHLTTNHRDIHNKRSLIDRGEDSSTWQLLQGRRKTSADWKYKRDQPDLSSMIGHSFVWVKP